MKVGFVGVKADFVGVKAYFVGVQAYFVGDVSGEESESDEESLCADDRKVRP